MACRYTYKGKTYEAEDFYDLLASMPPSEASKYMPQVESVPAAPFVGKTESWAGLALRRMLRYAAENGYDKLAWTTGEQQEERYWGTDQVSSAVDAFREVTKPESAREQLLEHFGRELAAVTPLEIVDAAVLPSLKHDQIRRAVIKAIPVDVVNVLSDNGFSAKDLLGKPDMVGNALPVNRRSAVARGLAGALQLVGTNLRTALNRMLSSEATGRDGEVLPAIRASDLDAREVVRLLSPDRIYGSSGSMALSRSSRALPGAEPSALVPTQGQLTGKGGKLSSAELADALNRHSKIISEARPGNKIVGYAAPPGEGMKGFYDQIIPAFLNKYGKKWGAKASQLKSGTALGTRPHWELDITPSMRQSVLTDGQALFEKQAPYPLRAGESWATARQLALAALGALDRAGQAVSSTTGAVGRVGRSDVKTVALGISPDIIHNQVVDLTGYRVTNAEDLAKLAQVYRNPQFETFRIFYLKGNTIVGHEGVTSRMPGSSKVFVSRTGQDIGIERWGDEKRTIMRSLKADGYWLLHNHPSGNATPSRPDLQLTGAINRYLAGFKGHVVIDSGEYGTIKVASWNEFTEEFVTESEVTRFDFSPDELLRPSIPHPLLGEKIVAPDQIAELAKQLQVPQNFVTVLYRNADGRVRAIQEMPLEFFEDTERSGAYFAEQGVAFGSQSIFTHYVVPPGTPFEAYAVVSDRIADLIERGILIDHIFEYERGNTFSLFQEGGIKAKPGMVLGKTLEQHTAYLVREDIEAYEPSRAVSKQADHWRYQTIEGTYHPATYPTKAEAIEAAGRHQQVRREQLALGRGRVYTESDERLARQAGNLPAGEVPAGPGAGASRAERLAATRLKRSDGRLVTFFHGGSQPRTSIDFSQLGRATQNPTAGLGAFFTSSVRDAERYGPVVSAFHLDLRNPKVVKVEDLPDLDTFGEAVAYRQDLQAQGFDGLIIRADHLGGPVQVVAFSPEQIIPKDLTVSERRASYGDPLGRAIAAAFKGKNSVALKELLDSVNAGPFDGGCLIVAKAIIRAVGRGELVRVVSSRGGRHGQTEHYGAEIDGRYYDAAGGFDSSRDWKMNFLEQEVFGIEPDVDSITFDVATGHDDRSEIPDDPVAEEHIADALYPKVSRATRVSEPRAPYGQTESPAFKEWFGKSVVVDARGRPLVVYHGTGADFTTFKKGRRGAIYFHYDPALAAQYPDTATAYGATPGARIIPAYVKAENPWNYGNESHLDIALEAIHKAKDYEPWMDDELRDGDWEMIERPEVRAAIKQAGFDSFYANDHPGDAIAVFDPTQVKSAIANRGTFSPKKGSILEEPRAAYGKKKPAPTGPRPAPYQVPAPTLLDSVIRVLEDKNIDIKRLVEAIRGTGRAIPDELNPVLKEEMYLARVAQRNRDFITDELEPLTKMMMLNKVSMDQLDAYLHARHAKEANEYLKNLNPDREDNEALSGMTDDEAQAILDAANTPLMDRLAGRVDEILAKTRQILVAYGLESQETIDKWRETYDFYVPLKRAGFEDALPGTGMGRNIRGPHAKPRMGSHRAVVDILANVAMDREKAVTRGEKMRPVIALAGLLMTNPNKQIASLVKAAPIVITDPETGLEETVPAAFGDYKMPMIKFIGKDGQVHYRPDRAYKGRDNVVNFRIEGKDYAIVFNEQNARALEMAAALKDLDIGQLNTVLSAVAPATRYLASINTQYNPIFGIVNFIRDVQFAMLSLGSTPLAGKRQEILSNAMAAIKGIYADARAVRRGDHPSSSTSQLWERFQHVGGPTGYRDLFRTSDDRAKAIEHLLDPDWWQKTMLGKAVTAGGLLSKPESLIYQKGIKGLLEWLSDYNLTMENAIRLAVFQAGVESGLSDLKAASLAKNITVNFNKKGQISAQMGAMFAFFNASVQGTARLAETLFESGKFGVLSSVGKKIIAGGVTLGVIQTFALAMAGFDDGEPPEWLKARSLAIPVPGTDKGYVSFPMPLGFHVIPNVGRLFSETLLYGRPFDRLYKLFNVVIDSFSPVGAAATVPQFLAPTVVDPVVALSENRDWTGRRIYKEDFDKLKPTPGPTRALSTSSPWARGLAEAINYATGGTDYTPGKFSPTPDAIDYLIGQATGGIGREVSKTTQIVRGLTTGEAVPLYKVPLVGRFVGSSTDIAAEREKFYRNVQELNEVEAEVKGRRKNREDVAGYLRDHPEAQLVGVANAMEQSVQDLNRRKRDLVKRGAPAEQVRLIEMQVSARMRRLNDSVRQLQAR